MKVHDQPVSLNGKLYIRGVLKRNTVLEYTPGLDQWEKLPPPLVENFSIATLRGQLLVVGGESKSTSVKTNTILTFDEHSRQWVQSYPTMPIARISPAVVGYQDYLIVMGGQSSYYSWIPNVNILDTTTNKWRTAESLPCVDTYYTTLVEDFMYLIGPNTKVVLRAHVPTLISGVQSGVPTFIYGAQSGIWEKLQKTPYHWSSPVTNGNTLLTVGGSDWSGNPTTSIQMYDPTTNQWTRVGDLPEAMINSRGIIINSELFVFGSSSVYASKLHS